MGKIERPKCRGKWRYPNFERAVHAALVANARRGVPLRPYECPACGDWHLTKRPANPAPSTVPGPFTPKDLAQIIAKRRENAS